MKKPNPRWVRPRFTVVILRAANDTSDHPNLVGTWAKPSGWRTSAHRGYLTAIKHAFSILNMSSDPADLLPQARIRLAALELFGQQGFHKTTVRQIAERAGVSPGLVIHHYGSKHALRQTCDDYAMAVTLAEKSMFGLGSMPAMSTYMDDHPEMKPVFDYLVRALRDGGPVAEQLFVRLCEVSEELLETGVAGGMINPPSDPEGTAALLGALSAGLLLTGDLFARQLGGTSLTDPAIVQRYVLVATQLFSQGLFTPAYAEALQAAAQS